MKIIWKQERCVGHGRCYALAPELWDADDDGYAVLKVDGEIPPELHAKAQLSADNCPEWAIEIVR